MIRFRDPFANPEPLIERVYAYVAYRLGDGPEAEDVTSETFARALRYRESYDRSKGEPIAWLLGIARKCVAAALAPRPEVLMDVPVESGEGPFEHQALDRMTLAAAVARLNDRDRELVALRYGADMTASQIAARLDLTTNAVEVALHRALARLRAQLELPPTEEGRTEAVRVSGAPAISIRGTRSASTGETG
jgi:RNA polymerase sigma-70 factor (ECF subfamily)